MIGSCIAAILSVGSGVMANSIGVGGIPGILSIQTKYMGIFALAMIIAIVVPFVLTVIIGKKKLTKEDLYGEKLIEIPIPDMIKFLKQMIKEERLYRRYKPFLQMLKGFNLSEWSNLVVLHYGH